MRKLIFLFFIITTLSSTAQISIDIAASGFRGSGTGLVNVVDPSTLGTKKVEIVNYTDIQGSPFWIDKWSKAFLYLKNGNLVKLDQVKLNLYTNEVDYIDAHAVEMVLDASNFKQILLMKQADTSHIAAIFECFPDMVDPSKGEAFYHVLNTGAIRLLVLEKPILKTGAYDPMLGKEPKSFYSKKNFAISNDGVFSPLQMLDRDIIMTKLKTHQIDLDWLNTHHNKLRSESEVKAFLEFYNTKKK